VQGTGRQIGEGWWRRRQSKEGEGRGDLRRESGVRLFSRRQSEPIPVFLSPGVPERTPEGRGWPGLAGWMKAQLRAKTRNREHD
jgi:hypothetical protein